MDMTINSDMTVDSVEFLTNDVELTYSNSPASQFTLAGLVGVSISGIGSLSVTFSQTASGVTTPGLVVTNGTPDLAGHDDRFGHDGGHRRVPDQRSGAHL